MRQSLIAFVYVALVRVILLSVLVLLLSCYAVFFWLWIIAADIVQAFNGDSPLSQRSTIAKVAIAM